MKHAIKIDVQKSVTIEPGNGYLHIGLQTYGIRAFNQPLTPDQAEAIAQALMHCARESRPPIVAPGGVRCHGDLCKAGQIECPTPDACGMKTP